MEWHIICNRSQVFAQITQTSWCHSVLFCIVLFCFVSCVCYFWLYVSLLRFLCLFCKKKIYIFGCMLFLNSLADYCMNETSFFVVLEMGHDDLFGKWFEFNQTKKTTKKNKKQKKISDLKTSFSFFSLSFFYFLLKSQCLGGCEANLCMYAQKHIFFSMLDCQRKTKMVEKKTKK